MASSCKTKASSGHRTIAIQWTGNNLWVVGSQLTGVYLKAGAAHSFASTSHRLGDWSQWSERVVENYPYKGDGSRNVLNSLRRGVDLKDTLNR